MDAKLLDYTYDRITAIAQCRDLTTVMEIVDQVAHSVGAASHALLRCGGANGGTNRLFPPWSTSPLGDLYVSSGFDKADPVQRTLMRLRRPVTADLVSREEAQDTERLTRFLRESGIQSLVAVPIFKDSVVTAAFSLHFSDEAPAEAGWVAGLIAPTLFEQAAKLAEMPVDGDRQGNPLTPRELECLIWSADGKTSWEISEILSVSERTVNAHLGRAIRKLGVVSRTQAVADAIRRGLFR